MSPYSTKKLIKCRDTHETVTGDNYLASRHWRNLRASILSERGNACQKCKKKSDKLNVHHITYKRIGNEKKSDLLVVCENCHSKIHNKKKKKPDEAKAIMQNKLVIAVYLELKAGKTPDRIAKEYRFPLSEVYEVAKGVKGKYGKTILMIKDLMPASF